MPDDYSKIPELTMTGLTNYRDHHIKPGQFVMAVLENNLFEAFGRADEFNKAAMHQIVKWVYNRLSPAPWGNSAAIREWIAQGSK